MRRLLLQWHLQYFSLDRDVKEGFTSPTGQPSKTFGPCFPGQRRGGFSNTKYCRDEDRLRGKVEIVQKDINPKYSICHAHGSGNVFVALSCYELGAFHATQMLLLPQLIPSLCKMLANNNLVCVPFYHYYMHLYHRDEVCYRPFIAFICQSGSFLVLAYWFRDFCLSGLSHEARHGQV